MNGAEALVRTLLGSGIDMCFANPGTSEMHFVAALDRVEGMRCVLCLEEGSVTGAAEGYARMAEKPASTLLHLGPGLANGLTNLHNARRGYSPMVNIVGEHATYHRVYDAPLTSDIEAVAKTFSHWVHMATEAGSVAQDAAGAIAAARRPPGQIATLILPADVAWNEAPDGPAAPPAIARPEPVEPDALRRAAAILRSGEPAAILMTGRALRATSLDVAGRIAAATGCRLLAQTSNARMERGAGRVAVERIPYPVDAALKTLHGLKHLILIGGKAPVAFFAYPDKPSVLTPSVCEIFTLARIDQDLEAALAGLAEELGATKHAPAAEPLKRPAPPQSGPITPETLAATLAAQLPENAVVVDESISVGRAFYASLRNAPPHDWLQLTGGAIGDGLPLATGAAIACPDRPVICLEGDGSAMYNIQSLWTQAREKLDVTTLVMNNRSYAILKGELANVGAQNAGPKALDMMSLDKPDIDWSALARSLGVESHRASTVEELNRALDASLAARGPQLIDVVL
jgi:acetolactate synthase I/II/III large subunit